MFRRRKNLTPVISNPNPAETKGKPVFEESTGRFWKSQRKTAKEIGVSENMLSKHLHGKLPKLDR